MRLTVRFYGVAYDKTGVREWKPEIKPDSTISYLLDVLVEEFPRLNELVYDETGKPFEYLSISVNNQDILGLNGSDTRLCDGDIVFIMPPIGGG
ncbi:MAG: MoaD/ThiS family protein [Candidatus Bathyarchaeota archaeon]|nr:MoaD/ThiS family protein [Candidatus Bathyarchaeota archaeon]